MEQKKALEAHLGMNCPIADDVLLEEQRKGFCLSSAGLTFELKPWMKSLKEPPPAARDGNPTVREFLFQLTPNFSRLPVDSRVHINFDGEDGLLKVSDGIDDYRNNFEIALARKFPEGTAPGESRQAEGPPADSAAPDHDDADQKPREE